LAQFWDHPDRYVYVLTVKPYRNLTPFTPTSPSLTRRSLSSQHRLEKCSTLLSRKDFEAVKRRFQELEEDILNIESNQIHLPAYPMPGETLSVAQLQKKVKAQDTDRRKGVPWTEEEHRLFLMGLAKYGKGDWRSISRNFVITRTPTQVASHAQKYFIRLNSQSKKDKRRASIHDITTVVPSAIETGVTSITTITGHNATVAAAMLPNMGGGGDGMAAGMPIGGGGGSDPSSSAVASGYATRRMHPPSHHHHHH